MEAERREFSYGAVIRDTFRISWRNKFLWFFGFFAAGGATNISSNFTNIPTDFSGGLPPWVENNLTAIIATAIVVAVVFTLAVIFLYLVSVGGLSESVAAIDRGEERRFGSTFRAGMSHLWRVLGQIILLFLIGAGLTVAIFLVAGVPILLTFLLTADTTARIAVGILFGLLGGLLLILVFIPFAIIGQYALRALVVDGSGMSGGIREGYGLFRRNIGKSLLLWLINIGLSFGVGVANFLITLLFGLILFLPAILLGFSEAMTGAIVAGVFGGILLLPILILLGAATGTYFHAFWTVAYMRLTGRGSAPEPTTETVA
ncbi:MAG: hypothetical protein M3494_17820 [Actinomycetota bacterium]|jgi:hypothetical protein|nr:hypothetical protein [Rubrobacter sp.]MDQ3509835.1 hypothetical protein [Actinomycetota bacterium]